MKCCTGKEKVVSELKQLAEKADHIYREKPTLTAKGSHCMAPAGSDWGDDARYNRVVFNEITKNAIRPGI